jgi:FkbM family methyltransferase
MINLDNFDWNHMNDQYLKDMITKEIFIDNIYQKFFEVNQNDIVLDIGASVGPFTYSILHKNPKHVYCIEPSESEFKTLVKNTVGNPVTPINKGISNTNSIIENDYLYGGEKIMESITFSKLIDLYSLEKIDFIKTDCEGGEYDIFTEENFSYIKNNVRKIVGEWHLNNPEYKNKFRKFRDEFLSKFENFHVLSVDGIDIKWDLWNEHFIEYYNEIILHIDNR